MQHDITKLCADSLRTFVLSNHDIKLKSSHAHELVAAFFGYHSKAALLADTRYPLSNLRQAEFILFRASIGFVDQRIKALQLELPDALTLSEGFYSALVGEKWLMEKVWPSFDSLAMHIAEQRIHQRLKTLGIDPAALQWDMRVEVAHNEDAVLLTVDAGYLASAEGRLKDSAYIITLPRIAANLGYGKPEVQEIRFAGEAMRGRV